MNSNTWLKLASVQAIIATMGSLYYSDVVGLIPCTLCWYQRIAMYPLALVLPLLCYKKEYTLLHYLLPQVYIGWLIAAYHNIMYYDSLYSYGFVAEAALNCSSGVSCTSETVAYFGFITIPLLSLIAFSIIAVSILQAIKKNTMTVSSNI